MEEFEKPGMIPPDMVVTVLSRVWLILGTLAFVKILFFM